jgi:hypothetical protein
MAYRIIVSPRAQKKLKTRLIITPYTVQMLL